MGHTLKLYLGHRAYSWLYWVLSAKWMKLKAFSHHEMGGEKVPQLGIKQKILTEISLEFLQIFPSNFVGYFVGHTVKCKAVLRP